VYDAGLMAAQSEVVGREQELAAIDAFLDAQPGGPAVLLVEGEAGIGKTTLWLGAVQEARVRGQRVLDAVPAEAERDLPFSALGDLLGGVIDSIIDRLPPPQAQALKVALLLDDGGGRSPDRRAVALAVLSALRLLSADGAVLIAIDDVQWLDAASGDVLRYAVRRLRDEPIRLMLLSRGTGRSTDYAELDTAPAARSVHRLSVEPLSLGAIGRLMRLRLEVQFSRPDLDRLHRLSAGNPFYALELGRALREGTLSLEAGTRLPAGVEQLVSARIEALPTATRDALAAAAAVAEPTLSLLGAAIGKRASTALRAAVDADVIVLDGDGIRFVHPLLATAAYGSVSATRARQLHAALAGAVGSADERARQLALSSDEPDDAIAAVLDEAAHRTRSRGAPGMAAEMLDQAYGLTPAAHVEHRIRRRIQAAEYHLEAGDTARAREELEELLELAPSGPQRAEVLVNLARTSLMVDVGSQRAEQLLMEAADHAGHDVGIQVRVEGGLAWCAHNGGDLRRAEIHARAAVELGEQLGDVLMLATALANLCLVEFLMGRGYRAADMSRALELEARTDRFMQVVGRPSWIDGMLQGWSGNLEAAISELVLARAQADERGDANALPFFASQLARMSQRAGRMAEADAYADESEDGVLETGQDDERQFSLAARALVDAHLGRVDAARRAIEDGLALAASGSVSARFEFLAIRGFLDLSVADPVAALTSFDRLLREVPAAGFNDPGPSFRYQGDAAEALIEVGRLDEAGALVDWLDERGRTLDRPWALATAARCRALIQAARGDMPGAMDTIGVAQVEQQRVGEPFELGRTLLAKGTIARRGLHRRLARESIEAAIGIFEGLGASLWVTRAQAEGARIGGRAPSGDALTTAEREIAALIGEGLTNREAAARLFVTEATVEAALVRVYAKLGVRSRSELVGRLISRADN
jgi:DNA-binding CsgD family transcriptional regulator/tetratricopeptide (TPR) repeat protein